MGFLPQAFGSTVESQPSRKVWDRKGVLFLGRGRVGLVTGSCSHLGRVGAFEIAKPSRQLCKQIWGSEAVFELNPNILNSLLSLSQYFQGSSSDVAYISTSFLFIPEFKPAILFYVFHL